MCRVYFVSETARVELKSGRVDAPAASLTSEAAACPAAAASPSAGAAPSVAVLTAQLLTTLPWSPAAPPPTVKIVLPSKASTIAATCPGCAINPMV
jgi:hypothetical protein